MDLEEEFYEGLYEDGTEEQPIVLEDPKAQVYLPVATTKTKGIASFDAKDFNVDPTGKVALNEDLHQIKENTDTALEKSQEALTNSEEALTTANTALSTVNGIDGKATEALTNSGEALTTANTAISTANTALSTANGIDGKATEALNTAREALEQVIEDTGSKVYVNGVLQTSVNVNRDIQGQFDQLTENVENVQDQIDQVMENVENIQEEFDQLSEDVEAIQELVPNQASSQNPLADKNFVNSSINAIAAFYITYDSQGNPFPTKAALTSATTFYSAGAVRVPTRNDYCLVLADETHDNASCRYVYSGEYPNGQWDFQFVVNETPFTSDQIAAINSGITSALVQQISTLNNNKADRNNSEQSITTGNLTITGTLYIS